MSVPSDAHFAALLRGKAVEDVLLKGAAEEWSASCDPSTTAPVTTSSVVTESWQLAALCGGVPGATSQPPDTARQSLCKHAEEGYSAAVGALDTVCKNLSCTQVTGTLPKACQVPLSKCLALGLGLCPPPAQCPRMQADTADGARCRSLAGTVPFTASLAAHKYCSSDKGKSDAACACFPGAGRTTPSGVQWSALTDALQAAQSAVPAQCLVACTAGAGGALLYDYSLRCPTGACAQVANDLRLATAAQGAAPAAADPLVAVCNGVVTSSETPTLAPTVGTAGTAVRSTRSSNAWALLLSISIPGALLGAALLTVLIASALSQPEPSSPDQSADSQPPDAP